MESTASLRSRVVLSTVLYWVLLFSFISSYLLSENSISLILTADRLVDAVGMTIALGSQRIVSRPPTAQFTYGFHRFESLSSAGMITAFFIILFYSGYVAFADVRSSSYSDPVPTAIASVLSLAILPVISLLLHEDQNLTSQTMNVHTIQDIITSALALAASVVIVLYNRGTVGFLFSVLIIGVSIYLNRGLVSRNLRLLMEGTELDAGEIERSLKKQFPMVHHLHIWDVCKHYRLATVHVYADRGSRLEELDEVRQKISDYLSRWGINHLTVQFESSS